MVLVSLPKVIEAIYEQGVLKPLEKLDLREGQRVRIVVEESIVDIVRRYREKYGLEIDTRDIEEFIAERR